MGNLANQNQIKFYDLCTDFDYDIPLYKQIFSNCSGSILELAAGTGRVSIPLAQMGHKIIALDISPEMLVLGRKKCTDENIKNITWLQADMTNFAIDLKATGIFIAINSFLLLSSLLKQKLCLKSIVKHLLPGGIVVIDVFYPPVFLDEPCFKGQLSLLSSRCEPENNFILNRWFTGQYDSARQIVIGHNIIETCSADGEVKKYPYTEILRYIHRFEMELLLEYSGLEIEEVYGWYDRRPFDAKSRKMIYIARKK